MTSVQTSADSLLFTEQETKMERILEELFFVFSIFNEESGPVLLYNDSPLEKDIVDNLNLKVFTYLMQGSDFGPNNFAKLRGIVQIPHSEYYTSAIDILVKKRHLQYGTQVYVPLVIFLIFPRKDLVTYAKIAENLEDFISRKFGNGFNEIPSLKSIEHFINLLYSKIKESR
ncbi:MAG: hypothetical protein ACTSQF_12825 [Candidatus Heimdallarchaeaceae archaeon]